MMDGFQFSKGFTVKLFCCFFEIIELSFVSAHVFRQTLATVFEKYCSTAAPPVIRFFSAALNICKQLISGDCC